MLPMGGWGGRMANDTTARALVEHWKTLADRGLMNPNTANSMRAACVQVLAGVGDGWEGADVRELRVDDLLRRFERDRKKDFTPGSIASYKSRFTSALQDFLAYVADPEGWRGPEAGRRRRRVPGAPPPPREHRLASAAAPQSSTDFPFPLPDGRMAHLRLPRDLKSADVRRITAFLNSITVDFELDKGKGEK
jgi:hypothetical protein